MKRVLAILLLVAACSGGSKAVTPDPYTDKANAMVKSGELVMPPGASVKSLVDLVKYACLSPQGLIAMSQSMQKSPYFLAMAFKIAQAGCPDVLAKTGIQVNDT